MKKFIHLFIIFLFFTYSYSELEDCRSLKLPISKKIAEYINPSLFKAQGVFIGTAHNYIQYYNGTIVDTNVIQNLKQTKKWSNGKYIDTVCFIGKLGECISSISVFFTRLELNSILPDIPAHGCSSTNDTNLGDKISKGIEISPFNWYVNYLFPNGTLFATESIINIFSKNEIIEREITFKIYLQDFIFVTLIHQIKYG
ncbi:MAG: hypothetical protein QW303_07190 [Nitrososphaerota archaeon]